MQRMQMAQSMQILLIVIYVKKLVHLLQANLAPIAHKIFYKLMELSDVKRHAQQENKAQ